MTGSSQAYEPHPHIGGRNAVLRALAAWRMEWPGAPRVVLLTGSAGTGRSRLLTGFLMLCDPEYRKRLPLDRLDPATVPPELPAPAVPDPRGLTTEQFRWVIADHYGLQVTRSADVLPALGALDGPLTLVVPDVDRAGVIRTAQEPARLTREVLAPLAALPGVRLLADLPRAQARELADLLPPGTAQVVDLDEEQWADPEGLVLQAEALLDPYFGAPELPYTAEAADRRALAQALVARSGAGAGSRLTVRLAVNSVLMQPEGFDPADPAALPADPGEALDLHARRLGADPRTLRAILAPLALAEGEGLPVQLLGPLASALAQRDMRQELADGMVLAAPFIEPVELPADTGDGDGPADAGDGDGPAGEKRALLRLLHPGVAEVLRAGLPDVRTAQSRIAMALLEEVPEQDWSKADPYVRDYIAAHTLEAGLLPQLLTDPGLFTFAEPTTLRSAVECVPVESLGAPARTYLRTAPLLTRGRAPVRMRAALLETAFVEDGLGQHAEALHRLLPGRLPWQTLWSVALPGVSAVTVGRLPAGAEGTAVPDPDAGAEPGAEVAVLVVPPGTPGARTLTVPGEGGTATETSVVTHPLARPGALDTDPAQVQLPSQAAREQSPLGLSRGADYVRVWQRADERPVAVLPSAVPLTAVDLSPDGVLLVATATGAKALRISAPA